MNRGLAAGVLALFAGTASAGIPYRLDLVTHVPYNDPSQFVRAPEATNGDWLFCCGPYSAGAQPMTFSSGIARAKWVQFLVVWQPYSMNARVRLRAYRWVYDENLALWQTEWVTVGPELSPAFLGGHPIGHYFTDWWNEQVSLKRDWYLVTEFKGDSPSLYAVRVQGVLFAE